MTISSLTSSSAASQLSFMSKLGSTTTGGDSGQVRNGPPPSGGGGFIDAIASALQSIGVSDDSGTTSDGSASSDGSGTGGNAAQALGSFLQDLMGALHQQNASSDSQVPADGQSYGPPQGQGGPRGPGGPGQMEADLKSLIAKLAGSGASSGDAATATDDADSTGTASTTALETSFKSLLQALGGDGSGASGKLSSFLQALSDNMPGAGSSGNLINTTA